LIFNQFLSHKELKKSFSDEEWDSLDNLLGTFLKKEQKPEHVLKNKKIMGEIHQSSNLDKYRNKKFRKELFEALPVSEQDRYFQYCGIKEKISSMIFEKLIENINEFIEFDWGDNEKTKKFLKYLDLPEYLIPDDALEIKNQEEVFGANKNYHKEIFHELQMLHSYQSSIVHRTLKLIETANRKCLIQMPTGTGKTRVAMEIIAYLFNQNPNIRIIWLASKHELLEQAHETFIRVWNHVGKNPLKIFNMWMGFEDKNIPKSKTLIFTTYGKLNNLLEQGYDLKSDYVFVDEAHQILAPTFNHAVSTVSSTSENETRIIGLTATPGRGINEEQNIRFVHEFQGQIIRIEFDGEDKIYKGKPLQYLEDNEVLAKTIPEPLPTNYEFELPKIEWEELAKISIKTGDYKEFDERTFKHMANDNIRNILIIRKLIQLIEEGKKILYFSTTKNQSLMVFTVLQQLGKKAIHVSGETNRSFRRQVNKKFKETKEIDVICNYDIFATGFDVPKLDVVFIARPVNSPVLFNQIVGRGTRGLKMDGTAIHTLVQVIDKKPSRFIGFDPYKQYGFWDPKWK
jgi:DNA repair protein RadD